MSISEIISTIIAGISSLGWGGTLIFYHQKARREKSLADEAEEDVKGKKIENENAIVNQWIRIADEREQKIIQKDTLIDRLFQQNGEWRDKYHAEVEAKHQSQIEKLEQSVKLCNKRKCLEREPQTGY